MMTLHRILSLPVEAYGTFPAACRTVPVETATLPPALRAAQLDHRAALLQDNAVANEVHKTKMITTVVIRLNFY